MQVSLKDRQAWNSGIWFIFRDGLSFPMGMIRITAEKPYFVIVHAHAPISDQCTTSAATDRQFHLPGKDFFTGEDIFSPEKVFFFHRRRLFKVRSQSVNMNFDQNIGGISIQKLGIRVVLSYADLLLQATSGSCSSILYKAK